MTKFTRTPILTNGFFSWNKWRLYHSIIEKETLGLSQFSPFTDFLREREKMFYTYSRPMKFVEYEFQAVFPIIFSMDLLHTPFCLHVLHRIGETIFVLLFNFAPHFLCWILGAVQFNTRGGNLQNDIFYSKWPELSFWVKIVVIWSVAQLVTTVIFFLAWDKSRVTRVTRDNSWNST